MGVGTYACGVCTTGGVYLGGATMGGVTAGGVTYGAANCGGVTTGGVTTGIGGGVPGTGVEGIGMEEADSSASRNALPDTTRVNSLGPAGATAGGGAAAEGWEVNTRVAPVGAEAAGTNGWGGGAAATGGAGTGLGSAKDGAGVGGGAGVMAAGGGATTGICGAPKIRVNAPGSRRSGTASKRFSGPLDLLGDSNNFVNPPGSWRGGGGMGEGVGASLCPVGLNLELKNCVNSPSVARGGSSPSMSGAAAGAGGARAGADGASGVGTPCAAAGLANSLLNSPVGSGDAGALPPAGRGCRGALKTLVNSPAELEGGAGGGTGTGGRGVSVLTRNLRRRVTSPGGMNRCGTAAGVEANGGAGWADAGAAWPNALANSVLVSESLGNGAWGGGPGCFTGLPNNSANISRGGCLAAGSSADPEIDVAPSGAAGAGLT